MPKFTVRIELHGADPEDYETLHEKMEEHNFLRTIIDDAGSVYQCKPTVNHLLFGK